jgi:trehalose-phosphatase
MSDEIDEFLARLEQAPARALLSDYDGTLAPFRKQRDRAVPYPGVETALQRLADDGRTRVVVVSGRAAGDIPRLMPLGSRLEVWGSHGLERRLPDGTYRSTELPAEAREALEQARQRADRNGWSALLEIKPAGLALHWRGEPAEAVAALRREVPCEWRDVAARAGLELHEFDGGLELRRAGHTKAAVVDAIFGEMGDDAAVAYLGDDATDEDAFRAIRGRGLGVLVRPEFRETLASAHLAPPKQLLDFLGRWAACCGGKS